MKKRLDFKDLCMYCTDDELRELQDKINYLLYNETVKVADIKDKLMKMETSTTKQSTSPSLTPYITQVSSGGCVGPSIRYGLTYSETPDTQEEFISDYKTKRAKFRNKKW
jgi:hypothetical protein